MAPPNSMMSLFKTRKFAMISIHLVSFGLVLAWLVTVFSMYSLKSVASMSFHRNATNDVDTFQGNKVIFAGNVALVILALLITVLYHPFQVAMLIAKRRYHMAVIMVFDVLATLPFLFAITIHPDHGLFWLVAFVHVLVVVVDIYWLANECHSGAPQDEGNTGKVIDVAKPRKSQIKLTVSPVTSGPTTNADLATSPSLPDPVTSPGPSPPKSSLKIFKFRKSKNSAQSAPVGEFPILPN